MNQRGFTVVELVVTIAIMAILFAIALPATQSWRESAANKEAARELLTWYRQARSEAVTESQLYTVTLNLTDHTFTGYDGSVVDLPHDTIQARYLTTDAWGNSGSYNVTFFPKGSCSTTLYIRINNDSNLEIRLDATATGLARM